jgi:integrase
MADITTRYGTGSVYQRGSKWWISYYHRGERYREAGGVTDVEARRRLRARLKEIHGDRFVGPSEERITVDELLDDLVVHLQNRDARSLGTVASHLKHVREFFGQARAAEVTTAMVERYISGRKKAGAANATINRQTGLLRHAFNLASRRKPPKASRPPYIPMLKENNARQGFVEPAALERIVAHLSGSVADATRWAYLTAWRRSHVLGLRWDQVDRKNREVRPLGAAANKRVSSLPLTPKLWDVIERRWAERKYFTEDGSKKVVHVSAYVFHASGNQHVDIRKAWARACKKAGVPGILFHDLRRSAVRNMIRAGVPQSVAMRISGHKTAAMFTRYDITSQDDKRAALAKVEEFIAGGSANTGEQES